jgi:hypothetical protein
MAPYATVEQLKQYQGITVATDDARLYDLLNRVSLSIDTYTGRWFEARTATRYYGKSALDIPNNTLWLDADLLTVTTLTNGDDSATVIASTNYWLLDRNVTPYWGIRLKANSTYAWEWDTDCWVSVAGTWGWSATPPADIIHAAVRWGAYCYHQKDAPVYDTTVIPEAGIITIPVGIPSDVERILKPYRRLVD